MRFPTFIKASSFITLMACGIGMTAGCDNTGTGSPAGTQDPGSPTSYGQATGYMKLHMMDQQSKDYKEFNVNVEEVEIQDAAGKWHQVSSPHRIINLLDVDLDIRALVDARVRLDVGHYSKLRLKLGDGCTVRLLDGTIRPLMLSADLDLGLVLDIDLDIRADLDIDAFINIDLGRCIQVVVVAGKPCYYLRPLAALVDVSLTGVISGVLRARVDAQVIAGATVYAEYFDEKGQAHIARTAVTDAQGRYKLDFLPFGRKYHVVTKHQGGGRWFKTFASAAIDLDADVSVRLLDIDLDIDLDVDLNLNLFGRLYGKVTPMVGLNGCDPIDLVVQVACGAGCNKAFIVDQTTAKVDGDESYEFKGLSKGKYRVQSSRFTCQAGGICGWAPLWISADVDIDLSLNLNVLLGINL